MEKEEKGRGGKKKEKKERKERIVDVYSRGWVDLAAVSILGLNGREKA